MRNALKLILLLLVLASVAPAAVVRPVVAPPAPAELQLEPQAAASAPEFELPRFTVADPHPFVTEFFPATPDEEEEPKAKPAPLHSSLP